MFNINTYVSIPVLWLIPAQTHPNPYNFSRIWIYESADATFNIEEIVYLSILIIKNFSYIYLRLNDCFVSNFWEMS